MGNPRTPRRATLTAAGVTLALLAVTGLGAAATARLSPVPILTTPPAPVPGTVTFDWTPPVPRTAPPTARPAATTADRVLDALLTDPQLAGYTDATAVTTGIYGGPFTRVCPGLYTDLAPVAGRMRQARSGATTVTVTAWTVPAGQAPTMAATLADRVTACTPTRQPYPQVTSTRTAGFTAVASNSGDGLTWTVRTVGDLVLTATTTRTGSGPDVTTATSAVDRFARHAARLLTAAGCRDLNPTLDDAGRNPYLPGQFTGWLIRRPVTLPAGPGRPAPTTPPPGYRAPTWAPAPVQPVDALAVPLVPATWPTDRPLPPLTDLPTAPAPLLADPAAFTAPSTPVTDEPQAPPAPDAPTSTVRVPVRVSDPDGPGCGWVFAGTPAPVEDPAVLQAANDTAARTALAQLTRAAADHQLALDTWVNRHRAYLAQVDRWRVWQEYTAAVTDAHDAWAQAQTSYDAAVAAYAELRTRWQHATDPAGPLVPAPTVPVPPTPTTPTPTPTPDPDPVPDLGQDPGLVPDGGDGADPASAGVDR